MVYKKIVDHAIEHKYALVFAGGVAAAIIGKKVLESKVVKDATTNCVAGALAVKQEAEDKLAEIKADAEEQVCEEEDEEKNEIEIEEEEKEEKPKKSSKKTSKKSRK